MANLKKDSAKTNLKKDIAKTNLKKDIAKVNKSDNYDLFLKNARIFNKEEVEESLVIINKLAAAIKKFRDQNFVLTNLTDIYNFAALCAKMESKMKYWGTCADIRSGIIKSKMANDVIQSFDKSKK